MLQGGRSAYARQVRDLNDGCLGRSGNHCTGPVLRLWPGSKSRGGRERESRRCGAAVTRRRERVAAKLARVDVA